MAPVIPFREALWVWLRLGLVNFGGPAGQIALMHRWLVEERRWVSETRFLHALNYCLLLPGPEAQQLATYIGWLLHGTRGGLVAGLLFILPGFVLMTLIAIAYVACGDLGWVRGLLFGLQAATLAIVAEAVFRLRGKALRHPALYAIAGAAFVAIFAFGVPFPLVIVAAALAGLALARRAPAGLARAPTGIGDDDREAPARPSPPGWTQRLLLAGVALWALPVALLLMTLGARHVFAEEAVFFSKMAVVTFGGAYAVLAYVAQQAVERYGWLLPGEMLHGLALAETTPGPLIMVLSFVGFLGAYRDPGALPPLAAGVLGATLATWVTFVPCFLWIFLGAPYIERLRGHRGLDAALAGIGAAVVGVILNLSVWFAIHVLFARVESVRIGRLALPWPQPDSLDPVALLLALLAGLALHRWRAPVPAVLAACAAAGVVWRLAVTA